MNYALEIREHNRQAHIDIENDIAEKKNGLFTFILRVNNGNIVDYAVLEYVNARKYLSITKVTIQKSTVTFNNRERSASDTVRPDDG